MSIEHFDEGVYASNYFSEHLDFRYPDQHLYAPPFFPALLEWTLILTHGAPHAVMWINVFFGTALVAAIGWLTRDIAGYGAALAAMAVATFSDFLIQYSRTALTDTPVCLFLVLAVGWGLRALRSYRLPSIVTAAVFTAAAWWTKYHGWLPIAILGAGLLGWCLFERPTFEKLLPKLGAWFGISVGSFLFWIPYVWSLQKFGGYGSVAENHSGYLVGLDGWWHSLLQQLWIQQKYASGLGIGCLVAILLLTLSRANHESAQTNSRMGSGILLLIALVLGISLLHGELILLGTFAVVGVVSGHERVKSLVNRGWQQIAPSRILTRSEVSSHESSTRTPSTPTATEPLLNRLEWWVLLAWTAGLAVSTPFYQPYPRLVMPSLTIALIWSGIGTVELVKSFRSQRTKIMPPRAIALLILLALFVAEGWQSVTSAYAWKPQVGLKRVSKEIISTLQDRVLVNEESYDAILYVIGEPGLYYHLASQEVVAGRKFDFITQPASGLGMLQPKPNAPPIPIFLAVGLHATEEKRTLRETPEQVIRLATFEYQPSPLVRFDQRGPATLEANSSTTVELWQLDQP